VVTQSKILDVAMLDTYFILATTEDGKTWVESHDNMWDNGKDAAEEAERLNNYYRTCSWSHNRNRRYRVRRVVNTDSDNFMVREAAKNHNYLDLSKLPDYAFIVPWRLAHFHPEDKTKARFFRCVEDAVQEHYTVTRLPRFLTNYCDLPIEDCEEFLVDCGYYSGSASFEILRDADEIEMAYVHGPQSCMNDPDDYPLPDPHPARAYASPDLGVAVAKRGNDVTARAVVFPERKIYYRIYGHAKLLEAWLKSEGYRCTSADSAWRDARLMKIVYDDDYDNGYICPYLDMSLTVSVSRYGSQSCEGYIL
jgi:hypothetical protein